MANGWGAAYVSTFAIHLALRNRALGLVVATTGSTTLAATTTGFSRVRTGTGTVAATGGTATFSTSQAGIIANGSIVTVGATSYTVSAFDGTTTCTLSGAPTFGAAVFTHYTGSFVAEGFVVGMEANPTGFAGNGVGTVTSVSATTLTTTGTRSAEAASSGRTLRVLFPQLIEFENVPLTRIAGREYITEEFSPSTKELLTSPKVGGTVEETGDYFLTWYGITAVGAIPGVGDAAIRKSVDALILLFTPGTVLTSGTTTVRIRGDVAPQTGQLIPLTGWVALQLKVPWRSYSANTISA